MQDDVNVESSGVQIVRVIYTDHAERINYPNTSMQTSLKQKARTTG